MFVPRSHGGLELTLPAGLAVIAALARIDGSVGWTAVSRQRGRHFREPGTTRNLRSHLSERAGRGDLRILAAGRNGRTRRRKAGGSTAAGRSPAAACMPNGWPDFASSPRTAIPSSTRTGGRWIRGVVLPAQDWEIEDTWHAAGLKGTGSHHIVLRDALVPEASLFDLEGGIPCVPGPLYPAVRQLLPLFHAAFSVGMAEGTLDDLVALAQTGRQQLSGGHADAGLRDHSSTSSAGFTPISARRGPCCKAQVASHWNHALAGTLNDEALLIEGTQAAVWISHHLHARSGCVLRAGRKQRGLRDFSRCSGACATFTSAASTPQCTATTICRRRQAAVAAQSA